MHRVVLSGAWDFLQWLPLPDRDAQWYAQKFVARAVVGECLVKRLCVF